jgi:hypothetical protein
MAMLNNQRVYIYTSFLRHVFLNFQYVVLGLCESFFWSCLDTSGRSLRGESPNWAWPEAEWGCQYEVRIKWFDWFDSSLICHLSIYLYLSIFIYIYLYLSIFLLARSRFVLVELQYRLGWPNPHSSGWNSSSPFHHLLLKSNLSGWCQSSFSHMLTHMLSYFIVCAL